MKVGPLRHLPGRFPEDFVRVDLIQVPNITAGREKYFEARGEAQQTEHCEENTSHPVACLDCRDPCISGDLFV